MSRTTVYAARWIDAGSVGMVEGDVVYILPKTRFTEPDRRGHRTEVSNSIDYRWSTNDAHGSRRAEPGDACTAGTLFPDVDEAERAEIIDRLIDARALVPIGSVYFEGLYPRVKFSADGLRFAYSFNAVVRKWTYGTPREGEPVFQVVERFPGVEPDVRRPQVTKLGKDDRRPFPWMFTASTIARDPDDPELMDEAQATIDEGVGDGRFKAVGTYEGGEIVFHDRDAERYLENEALLRLHGYQSADAIDDFREYRRILEQDAEERRVHREVKDARAQLDAEHPELVTAKAKKPRKEVSE